MNGSAHQQEPQRAPEGISSINPTCVGASSKASDSGWPSTPSTDPFIESPSLPTGRRSSAFTGCYSAEFIAHFVEVRDQLPSHLRAFLTLHKPQEYQEHAVQLYLHSSGQAGYGISPSGELVSVFSLPGAHLGDEIVTDAIARGARWLNCFDGYLPTLYGRFGFKETDRASWNPDFAPQEWSYERFGKPDFLEMRLQSASVSEP